MDELKLSDIAVISSGSSAPKDNEFSLTGYPFIRAGHLEMLLNGGDLKGLPKVSEDVAKKKKFKLMPKGTIFFAKSGMSATKNRVYISDSEAYYVNHLASLIPLDNINGRFLKYFLDVFKPSTLINDEAYPSIRLSDIGNIEIIVPPTMVQDNIVSILDEAQILIEKRKKTIKKLDDLVQSVFYEMFGDPILNSKNWKVAKLANIADVSRGKFTPRPRNDPSFYNGDYPFIQTGDISKSQFRLRKWNQTLNERGIKVSKFFPKGTIVIAIVGATIGATAILQIDCYAPDSVIGISPVKEIITSQYLEFVLRFWKPIFLAQAPATARANINLETLKPIEIPIPSITEQNKFSTLCNFVDEQKELMKQQLDKMEENFQSLLHQAFTGKLQSNEAKVNEYAIKC